MVSVEELRRVNILEPLTEPMLEKIGALAELRIAGEDHIVFKQGQKADTFYMLLRGKIVLEKEITAGMLISLDAVKPGFSFGWSALVPGKVYATRALCVEPCEILAVPGERLLALLEQEPAMGSRFFRQAMQITRIRMDRLTEQFVGALAKHPDLQKLMGLVAA